MLDSKLASLYGVATKVLLQTVKRNASASRASSSSFFNIEM